MAPPHRTPRLTRDRFTRNAEKDTAHACSLHTVDLRAVITAKAAKAARANPPTTPHPGKALAKKDAAHARARHIKDIAANDAAIAARLSALISPGEKQIFAHAKLKTYRQESRQAEVRRTRSTRRGKSASQKTAVSNYVSTAGLRAARAELESVHEDRLRVWNAAIDGRVAHSRPGWPPLPPRGWKESGGRKSWTQHVLRVRDG